MNIPTAPSRCCTAHARRTGRTIESTTTGRTIESTTADVFLANSEKLERIDRMIINAEARRNAALRERSGAAAQAQQGLCCAA
jgi:hypothetical protein